MNKWKITYFDGGLREVIVDQGMYSWPSLLPSMGIYDWMIIKIETIFII